MKLNKKIFSDIFILLFISIYLLATIDIAETKEQCGVILIAHGSTDPSWNQQILDLYGEIKPKIPSLPVIGKFLRPVEVAFLRFGNEKTLANALNKLKDKGIEEILLVHLSPSSYSIRHDEIKSIAEKTGKLSKPWIYGKPVFLPTEPTLQFRVSPAMDDHSLAVKILKDYTRELSHDPNNECLILLGYGPVEELENIIWVRQLERIGKEIRKELSFREIVCMTLRNHSADLIREQAIIDFVKTAKRLTKQGRVIVVPYVLCEGKFHRDLKSYLKGIIPPEDISMKGVISHPNTKKWVEEVIKKGMNQPEVKPINRNWSAMDNEKGKPVGSHRYGLLEN